MRSSIYRRAIAIAMLAALLPGCESKQAREAKYINQGKDLLAHGQLDQALLSFKNALRVNPIDPEPRYYLGVTLERKGDLNNAFVSFVMAVQQNPHYDPALLKIGRYYFSAGQTDEAQKRISMVLADNPDNAEANAVQAAIDLRNHDNARAEQSARIALDRDQPNIIARSVLAGLYGSEGRLAEAAQVVDEGITLNPDDVSLVQLKAQLFQKYPDPARVQEAYKTLIERRPTEATIRDEVAKYYVRHKDLDTAEAVLHDGLKRAPDNMAMRQELVVFLSDERGLAPAEKEIRGYMAADPQTDDYYFWLADLYVKYSAADRAMALLNELVQKRGMEQPGLDARTSLAQITFQHGDTALANKLLSIVLAADPGNKDALFVRARIEFDRGEFESANNDLRTILRSDATAQPALLLLSESLLSEHHLDLAIDTLNTLVDAAPTNIPARVRLAQLYHANNNTKRALELLGDLERLAPDYPVVWETVARIQLDEKDWADADAAIAKLDAAPGQHQTAQYLRGESAQRQGDLDSAIGYYTEIVKAIPLSGLSERAEAAGVECFALKHKPGDALAWLAGFNVDNSFSHTLRGELDLTLKKPDDASVEFQRAVAQKGGSADPYLQLARLQYQKGDVKAAEAMLGQAVTDVPSDIRPRMVLGDIETSRGEYQQAIDNYQAILDVNPGLDAAANNIAELIADYLYTDPVALERARVAADRFQTSNNPLLLDTVGWVYYREGNLSQAATFLQRAISFGKVPAEVHYHYGMLLLKQNQKQEAKQELILATQGDPHYAGLDEARQALASL